MGSLLFPGPCSVVACDLFFTARCLNVAFPDGKSRLERYGSCFDVSRGGAQDSLLPPAREVFQIQICGYVNSIITVKYGK